MMTIFLKRCPWLPVLLILGCSESGSDSQPGGAAGSAGNFNGGNGGVSVGGGDGTGGDGAGAGNGGDGSGGDGSGGDGSGGDTGGGGNGGASGAMGGGGFGGVGGMPQCSGGATTSLSGVVHVPAGNLPLYNVLVYVPSAEPAALSDGVQCLRCDDENLEAIASARTDVTGAFKLEGVPEGDVPLVIETGKWRRTVTIPGVVACQDNVISDTNLTRLPRDRTEGHIPRIALSTGQADAVECLLRKVGIADSEFTIDSADGRVNMFRGCPNGTASPASQFSAALGGAMFPAATTLWASPTKLDLYDVLLLSCEGVSCDQEKVPYLGNLKAYADKGGRVLFEHLHYRWMFLSATDWLNVASFQDGFDLQNPATAYFDGSFSGGVALTDWFHALHPNLASGQFELIGGQHSLAAVDAVRSRRWVYSTQGETVPHVFTFDTPSELAQTPQDQCGRVLFSDLHVVGGTTLDSSNSATPFPGGCVSTTLTQQEQAIVFMLFELTSCL